MYKINEKSFTISCESKTEAFKILLELAGYTKESFCNYMGVQEQDLEEVPVWAENYLKDLINADIVHLGYIMKDNKVAGIMGGYNELTKTIEQLTGKSELTGTQPLTIKDSIVTEDGAIKIKYFVNAENILNNFILSQTNK